MAINDSREDKAQLDRRDFDLDIEEQERQRKERDAMIIKVNLYLFSHHKSNNLFFSNSKET